MKNLKGYDISNHNNYISQGDFIICKATEGCTFKDPKFYDFANNAIDDGRLLGAYHYLSTTSDVTEQAREFVKTVKPFLWYGIVLALDVEGEALKWSNDELNSKCLTFLEEVTRLVGALPMVYCSSSVTPRLSSLAKGDYGLWVADYSGKIDTIGDWKFWAIHQYTDNENGYDANIFNGDMQAWLKYCAHIEDFEDTHSYEDLDSIRARLITIRDSIDVLISEL